MMRLYRVSSARRHRSAITIACLALLAVQAWPCAIRAQIISVKTTPLAESDQFSFYPTSDLGIAGVSIASRDTMHDPFVNPAKGRRLRRGFAFGAPTFFSASRNTGTGETLPAGVMGHSGANFGGASLAIQSLTDGGGNASLFPPPPTAGPDGATFPSDAFNRSHTNRYAFVMLGHSFEAARLSLGVSAAWSTLEGIDGVRLLYAGTSALEQSGGSRELRLGALKEWRGDQSLEAVVVDHRLSMSQLAGFSDSYWVPIGHTTVQKARVEDDRDQTRVAGVQLQYQRQLFNSGWRVGAMVTANRIDQPHMPRSEFTSIPSDRGRSSAFDVGLGLSRSSRGTSFAIDAIFEPITSHLAATADSQIIANSGATIGAGSALVDNRLHFSNAIGRIGLSHDFALEDDGWALRLLVGVQARAIDYTLDQRDVVRESVRSGRASWMEWTRTWGWTLRVPAVEFRYAGRLTTGAERPVQPRFTGVFSPVSDVAIPFPGPRASFTMEHVSVITQQLSLSFPIR